MTVNWLKTKDAISALESKLKCFICEKLPVDPQLLWCKHSFCEACIADQPLCPRCQFPVSPQETVPDIMLSKLLQAMRVAAQVSKCNEERDCDVKEKPISPHKPNKYLVDTEDSFKNVRKDVPATEEQSNNIKTNKIKIRALRRSNRGSHQSKSPQRGNQELAEVSGRISNRGSSRSKSPQRRSNRGSSRSKSPQRGNQEPAEVLRRRSNIGSSRSKSPQRRSNRGSSRSKSPQRRSNRGSTRSKSPQRGNQEPAEVLGRRSNIGSSRSKSPQRRSNRGSSRSKSPQRRGNRGSSRSKSPCIGKQDSIEASERRGKSGSRNNSPLVGKQELAEKSNILTKSQNSSPKLLGKKNTVMMTPKPKAGIKSSTPILFSAKKVQHTNKVNSKGETPLQIACRQGKLSLVQQLLREGAEPNVKDYANWTPLCDAVGSGNVEVVRVLLEVGAAVNTPANLNTTALVEAVVRRDRAMVELLMRHGADMNQRTALNNTALSLADDEMRAVMTSSGQVAIQPPPRVVTSPRTLLVDTQLSQPQLSHVMELCRQFNHTLSTEFTEDITHVVVEKTTVNTCGASTAVMLAIVSGCSVVGMDWVKSCLNAGRLVAVDDFEPSGTTDYPTSDVFHKARLNKEQLLPRLFDGCHISLQHDQPWTRQLKLDTMSLITAAGAVYQPRQCDPERVPPGEATVMYHTAPTGSLGTLSHVILYQAGSPANEPLLKYNMRHVKSLPLSWFYKCIQTFSITLD